jgi:monoamine oxidase
LAKKSYAEFFRSLNASPGALRLLEALNGSEIHQYSALHFLYQEKHDQDWNQTFKIKGGNDQFIQELLKRIKAPIFLNHRVVGVEYPDSSQDVLHIKVNDLSTNNTQQKILKSNVLFISASPYALGKITFSPSLSHEKQELIDQTPMQKVARINIKTKKKFWKEHGQKGLVVAYTDLLFERIWDMTATQEDTNEGVLTLYVQSQNASKICDLPESSYAHTILDMIRPVLPTIKEHTISMNRWCWHQAQSVGGGWAVYHQVNAHLLHHWWKPEYQNRLFFIGDHVSPMVGWIEGALESSERAVNHFFHVFEKRKESLMIPTADHKTKMAIKDPIKRSGILD